MRIVLDPTGIGVSKMNDGTKVLLIEEGPIQVHVPMASELANQISGQLASIETARSMPRPAVER